MTGAQEPVSDVALRLGATFGHEPSEVHTAAGRAGACCGTCFVTWPCGTVRKIDRVMVPVVERIAAELAADELDAEAAYDDACPDEKYARKSFASRLHERADNLRFHAAALAPDSQP